MAVNGGQITITTSGIATFKNIRAIQGISIAKPPKKTDKLGQHQQEFFEKTVGVTDVSVIRKHDKQSKEMKFFLMFTKVDDQKRYRLTFKANEHEWSGQVLDGWELEWYFVGRAVQGILDGAYEEW